MKSAVVGTLVGFVLAVFLAVGSAVEKEFAARTVQEKADYGWIDDPGNCATIHGWAWDPALPYVNTDVRIYYAGKLLGRVHADAFRQDLLDNHVGLGTHGFAFETKLQPIYGVIHAHELRVTVATKDGEHEIAGSPFSMSCW